MSALGAKSEAALRAAMARLLDGRPERTDDALTVSNLAYEAAVSRATANRAVGLLAEFRTAESCRRRSLLKALKERPSARSSRASSHARHRDRRIARPRLHARPVQPGADAAGRRPECRHREGLRHWPIPVTPGFSP